MESSQESQGAANLEFITFTDFSQTTHAETRRKVRSQAMRHVQRKIRDRKSTIKDKEISLDVSPLFGPSASQPTPSQRQHFINTITPSTIIPYPNQIGGGRIDPFAQYPIPMHLRSYELLDHHGWWNKTNHAALVWGDNCPMFKTLSKIGFYRTMVDPAGFRQILYTSASHMAKLRNSMETSDSIVLHIEAIQSINSRLADPILCSGDGIIGAVLAFACHAVMFNDIRGSLVHIRGLQELIRRRGGLDTLKTNNVLRLLIFWADVNIAFMHGHEPHFPPPDDLLPELAAPQSSTMGPLVKLSEACPTRSIAAAMEDLYTVNEFITRELATRREIWLDGVFAGLNVVPVLHKLMSAPLGALVRDFALLRQESYRVAAILYIAAIRRKFGVDLVTNITLGKLKEILVFMEDGIWGGSPPLLLWVLMIGGLQSLHHEEYEWFVSAISQVVIKIGCKLWDEVLSVFRSVLWIEGILESESEVLQKDIVAKLWTSHDYLFS